MHFGKYKLNWKRSSGGWFLYNEGWLKDPVVCVGCYHNKFELCDYEKKKEDHLLYCNGLYYIEENLYLKGNSVVWAIEFYDKVVDLSKIFGEIYDNKPRTEEEIKLFIVNFLNRCDHLLSFL